VVRDWSAPAPATDYPLSVNGASSEESTPRS